MPNTKDFFVLFFVLSYFVLFFQHKVINTKLLGITDQNPGKLFKLIFFRNKRSRTVILDNLKVHLVLEVFPDRLVKKENKELVDHQGQEDQ